MKNAALVALSQQHALRKQMDVIANNLANVGTTAYKAEKLSFAEHIHRGNKEPVSFVRPTHIIKDAAEGAFTNTHNPLDTAIHGQGYFMVATPQGTAYTRNGQWNLNEQQQIVTRAGYPILGTGGPLVIPKGAQEIKISGDGGVSADGVMIGTIQVQEFDHEDDLKRIEGGLFVTEQPPRPAAGSKVLQYMIEESNVKAVQEITHMIEVLRQYQSTQNLIDTEDERRKQAVSKIIKIS